MASFPKTSSPISQFLLFLAISSQIHLSLSLTDPKIELNRLSPKPTDVHDLMPLFGFPKGLLPNTVKSYTLSDDGSFEIELERPCYVQFDLLVYYEKRIKGKLSYGSVSDVSGIQAKRFFVWVSVTGIKAKEATGMLDFYVGFLFTTLPRKQFQKIPSCKGNNCSGERVDVM